MMLTSTLFRAALPRVVLRPEALLVRCGGVSAALPCQRHNQRAGVCTARTSGVMQKSSTAPAASQEAAPSPAPKPHKTEEAPSPSTLPQNAEEASLPTSLPRTGRLDFTSGSLFLRLYRRVTGRPPLSVTRSYAITLYAQCAQGVDLAEFLERLDMEDSFFSWFLVTELHLWMLSCRLMADGTPEARQIRNALVDMLWRDCEEKGKLIGGQSSSDRRATISDIGEQFKAALFVYDDGLLAGSDRDLAGAVWRRLLGGRDPPEPERIELAVQYIRRTLAALDRIDVVTLVHGGKPVQWLPLVDTSTRR